MGVHTCVYGACMCHSTHRKVRGQLGEVGLVVHYVGPGDGTEAIHQSCEQAPSFGVGVEDVKEFVAMFHFSEYSRISKGLVFRDGPLYPGSCGDMDGRENTFTVSSMLVHRKWVGEGRDSRSLCIRYRLRVALQSRSSCRLRSASVSHPRGEGFVRLPLA